MKLLKKVLTWIILAISSLVALWLVVSVWATVSHEFYWNQIITKGDYIYALLLIVVAISTTFLQLFILKIAFQKKGKYLLLLLVIPILLFLDPIANIAGYDPCNGVIGCSLPR